MLPNPGSCSRITHVGFAGGVIRLAALLRFLLFSLSSNTQDCFNVEELNAQPSVDHDIEESCVGLNTEHCGSTRFEEVAVVYPILRSRYQL